MTAALTVREVHDRVEARYAAGEELFDYSARAIEALRHAWVVDAVRGLGPRDLLDLGCSLGQLTAGLSALPARVFAMDLSPSAVRRARDAVVGQGGRVPTFLGGSATDIPLHDASLDLVVASDGPRSWDIGADDRAAAFREIHRVLRPGGYALFTEHLRPERFDGFIAEIASSPLAVIDVSFLYDRPWYRLESWFRAVHHWPPIRAARRSPALARAACLVGRAFGPAGSRHIRVLARKEPFDR